MIDKVKSFLEFPLACYLVKGIVVSLSVMFVIAALICGVLALACSLWWIIAFVFAGVLAGVSIAISAYLFNECY